jgi:glycosyltransferase involved in cell wall biosynthesis
LTKPVLSVVIAVFDDAGRLPRAIQSVRAQERENVEIIVVDDGSTDASSISASAHGAEKVVRLDSNEGPSMARNVGIALASGELVTFLDADDRMMPSRLQVQEQWLEANPDAAGVLAHTYFEVERGTELPGYLQHILVDEDSTLGLPVSAMIRMRSLIEHGGFDPTLRMVEDAEILMRLQRGGKRVGVLEQPLTVKSIHGRNATYASDGMRKGLLRAVHGLAARRPPLVTVIIPAFGAGKYLADAVRSVESQGVPDVEIVIVDDGSEDETLAVARRLEEENATVRVFGQPHAGPGAARNLGLLLARGRYIAMLDADDLWPSGRLKAQLSFLEENPECDLLFGQIEEFVSSELPPAVARRLRSRPVATGHLASAFLARRDAVARVGPFQLGTAAADWAEWYARAVEAGMRMDAVPQIVARRRLHGANQSLVHDTAQRQYIGLIRRSLARRSPGGAGTQ